MLGHSTKPAFFKWRDFYEKKWRESSYRILSKSSKIWMLTFNNFLSKETNKCHLILLYNTEPDFGVRQSLKLCKLLLFQIVQQKLYFQILESSYLP